MKRKLHIRWMSCVLALTLSFSATTPLSALLAPELIRHFEEAMVFLEFPSGTGSGLLVDEEGLILTAAHVVPQGLESARVTFANGETAVAEFVSYDPTGKDLAALRIESPGSRRPLVLADPDDLRPGRRVFSVGYPYPLYPALVGSGMVGGHRATHGILVHDAPVSSGSSGGPLVLEDGRVIGVVTSQLLDNTETSTYASGFNTAIDLAAIQEFLEALHRGERESLRTGHVEYLRMPLDTLPLAHTEEGELGPDSDRLPDRLEYAKGYRITLEEGQLYQISLASQDFDAYLLLYNSAASLVSENDDAHPATTDSEINYIAPVTGHYVVVATTFDRGEQGRFQIRADPMELDIELERAFQFNRDSPQTGRGHYYMDIWVEGRDAFMVVSMRSSQVDSYLEVYNEEGDLLESNDDWHADTLDALLQLRTQEGRSYRVRASTYDINETGPYLLSVGWTD